MLYPLMFTPSGSDQLTRITPSAWAAAVTPIGAAGTDWSETTVTAPEAAPAPARFTAAAVIRLVPACRSKVALNVPLTAGVLVATQALLM